MEGTGRAQPYQMHKTVLVQPNITLYMSTFVVSDTKDPTTEMKLDTTSDPYSLHVLPRRAIKIL
jgi:hypothetical protein